MTEQPKKRGTKPTAMIKLDEAGTEVIAELIADGVTYREIAKQYNVGLGRLCAWMELNAERSRACANARKVSAQVWDEKAEEGLILASDNFELAKARELASHYRWRAKCVNPHKYNDKPEESENKQMSNAELLQEIAKKLPD